MATSALAGTAIGTAIPGLGNILGLVIGAGVGAAGYYFGGKAGRGVGTAIGGAVSGSKELDAAQSNYEKALEDAADTIGKTAEEIENARRKLTEAEARLEKAKEADEAKKVEDEKKEQAFEALRNLRLSEYSRQGGQPLSQTARAGIDTAAPYAGYVYRGYRRPVEDLIVTPQGQFNTHPDDYIIAMKDPNALFTAGITAANNQYQTFQGAPGIVQHNTTANSAQTVNDLIVTPQGQFSTHPDDYIIAMKDPGAPVTAGIAAANNQHQTFQGAPGIVQHNTTNSAQTANDLIVTPQGQFNTHPDDYIIAMKDPGAPVTAGIAAANNRYQTFQGAPGAVQYNTNTAGARTVNDLIITPQGQFSTRPDDYILAMKNPAALVNGELRSEVRNEIRTVERVPQAIPPVVVEGSIELRSELTVDDKGYHLRQSVGKNTTPYKFATGNAKNARLIQ